MNSPSSTFEVIDDINETFQTRKKDGPNEELLKDGPRYTSVKIDLGKIVQDFIIEKKPTLYILTPCFGGICHVNYVQCLLETIALFSHFKFPLKIEFCKNDSLISRARNNLIAKAMNDPNTTHMLFIDNDIGWNPVGIFKLIVSNKYLIGGAYPLKQYEWKNTLSINQEILDIKNTSFLKNEVSDDDAIRSKLLKFNVNFLNKGLGVKDDAGKVMHIATGFMMIRRETIETMFIAYPSTKYIDDVGFLTNDENKFAYALFDCCVEDGHYLSEDWMFCHRWRKMNEDVYLNVGLNFIHTGMQDYSGSFLLSL